jgi:hypothetical protein
MDIGVTIASRATPLQYISKTPDIITDFSNIGFAWVRLQMLWRDIELRPGVYDPHALAVLDDCVTRCNKAGISVQFPLQTPPDFHLNKQVVTGVGPNGPWYEWDAQAAATFATFLATRYNGIAGAPFIAEFEIGNEGFDNEFVKGALMTPAGQTARDPKYFIPILQACSPAITAASPKTTVGMCALWWEDSTHRTSFIQALYDAKCGKLFRSANIHFYSGKTDPTVNSTPTRLSLQGQIMEVWNVMNKNGDGAKVVDVTEFGWSLADVSETTRISYYQKAYDAALASGHAGKMNLYTANYTSPSKNLASTQFSITQAALPAPHYTPTALAIKAYIAAHKTGKP